MTRLVELELILVDGREAWKDPQKATARAQGVLCLCDAEEEGVEEVALPFVPCPEANPTALAWKVSEWVKHLAASGVRLSAVGAHTVGLATEFVTHPGR